jgi:DNA polymerase III alpha subunit (gram-positive type)
MPNFTDVMVDIETTSLSPDFGAIIQIGAVKFDPATHEVSHEFFDKALEIPPNRYWSESTREWWLTQKREVLMDILNRGRPPRDVMSEFVAWVGGPCTFWSKPLSFDSPFIASYLREFGIMNPFPYWQAMDLRSFIRGMGTDFNEKSVPFEGDAHNALADALHQLRILYAAMDHHHEIRNQRTLDHMPG